MTYRPDEISLSTNSSAPGFLFLSEIMYPGWRAYIDGKPTRILRGNYLFRVIELHEGHHVVRFVFDPLSIKVGIGMTIFTLFMLLILIVYRFRKRIPFLAKA
ncbi:MAG: YfhO family protein [Pseudomonadota bacterium]